MAVNNAVVILGLTTVFFAVCSCGLGGLLLWMMYFPESEGTQGNETAVSTTADVSTTTNFTEEMKQRFPGYFRTVEEQRTYEKFEFSNVSIVPVANISHVSGGCFTYQKCKKSFVQGSPTNTSYGSYRARRAVSRSAPCTLDSMARKELIYHGCCVSYSSTISPKTLPTPGRMSHKVQVAQFPKMRQYFSVQECCHANDCHGCVCSRTYAAVSAVLKSPSGKLKIGLVSIPACCKCINIDD